MVAAAFRTIFALATTKEEISAQWDHVAATLGGRFPKAADLMEGAKEEALAFSAFPAGPMAPTVVDQTRSNASTVSSSDAAGLSASSPTKPSSSASVERSWWASTTSGFPASAATSPKLYGEALRRTRCDDATGGELEPAH